ncbi:MAG: YebC/PmpR family DNA-binding transcriptional regulator [Verrucomicrobia bacterium]|jgi:YebC/PmpR family DNA-binding regulatory protein|nr:YebC/PmpR family DNA-binding transcriptional regulator [Verrucomicrobiota bacterium]MDA7644892.1 YebC/PmpR family DNA-binding transcriptional regulator [bacterium]
MSGHNKWSKIKHTKGPLDAKRGKIFSKLSRELTVAAKIGGGDAELNARLRMVLLKSKQANMPADTIDRAVKKGVGGGLGTEFEDLVYEIYAPEGVAIMAEISTDNKNRTAAEIRHILSKNGGSIATSGAVTRLFHRKGQIIIARENADEDRTMEIALEAGAEDFLSEPQGFEIITEPSAFETVHKAVEEAGIQSESAGVTCLPDSFVPISTDAVARIAKIIDLIDEHDDVKDIYSNAQFPEE